MKRLGILFGSDNKFSMVVNTVRVCAPYFDVVTIVSSAIPELTAQFEGIELPDNVKVVETGFFTGDLDAARRLAFWGAANGDWCFWLDSDERPSNDLLVNLDRTLKTLEDRGNTSAIFPSVYHFYIEKNGVWQHDMAHWEPRKDYNSYIPKSMEEWEAQPDKNFILRRLNRRQPHTFYHSNFGGHTHTFSIPHVEAFVPYHINHLKTWYSTVHSLILSAWFNIFVNYGNVPEIEGIYESREFKLFNDFKQKTGVITQNDLVRKIVIEKDKKFIKSCVSLFKRSEFKDSKYQFTFFYRWATEQKCDLVNPESSLNLKCGYPCCRYGDIQL